MSSKNQLLLHIYQLGFDSIKQQIPSLEEVLQSHTDWLVQHHCSDERRTFNCKFDEWFASLLHSSLQHNPHFRLLGQFKNELHHNLAHTEPPPFDDFFSLHHRFFSLFMELYNHFHNVYAMYDYLTQLANRRLFDQLLKEVNASGTFIMADIDHFKQINDTFGHNCGDIVLSKISQLFMQHLPHNALLSRHGGEEFLFFLPHCEISCAHNLAETLRIQIQQLAITELNNVKITCSFGLAHHNQITHAYQHSIIATDKALYAAKHKGRNQTQIAS